MAEDHYTTADRNEQLRKLVTTLSRLIEHLRSQTCLAASAASYEQSREQALALLSLGFTREQLLEVSQAVPDLFEPYRYKEWESPEEWEGWYGEVALALRSALDAAAELRVIGKHT